MSNVLEEIKKELEVVKWRLERYGTNISILNQYLGFKFEGYMNAPLIQRFKDKHRTKAIELVKKIRALVDRKDLDIYFDELNELLTQLGDIKK